MNASNRTNVLKCGDSSVCPGYILGAENKNLMHRRQSLDKPGTTNSINSYLHFKKNGIIQFNGKATIITYNKIQHAEEKKIPFLKYYFHQWLEILY